MFGNIKILDPGAIFLKNLDPVLSPFTDIDQAVIRDLNEMHIRYELGFFRWSAAIPVVGWDRIIRDLAQGHTVATPATLVVTCVHVIDEDAFPINNVNLARILVELEASLVGEDIGLLVVLLEGDAFWWSVIEVPHQFTITGKFEDTVLGSSTGNPDKAISVRDNSLQ